MPAGTADRGDALGGVLKERSASQEHFIDLCRLLGEPTPADADPTGETYCFERGARRAAGGDGWADVWKRHHLRLAIQGAARQPSNPGRPLADIGVKMRDIQTIVGTWRLTGAGGGSATLPTPHHVKFVFSVEGGRVRGAIARQDNNGQLPVEVVLDGPRLRLRIIPPVPIPGNSAELSWLVLTPVDDDDAFEGYWEQASRGRLEPAIALRLVRNTD